MLQTWTMATPIITGIAERGGAPSELGRGDGRPHGVRRAGFVGTLASNSEFEIERYCTSARSSPVDPVIESISEEKRTRLGPGHFVTWLTHLHGRNGCGGRPANGFAS